MAAHSSPSQKDELLYMPTWTVAAVCTVFIVCCLCAERLIFAAGQFFKRKGQKALFQALEKIKEELMLVGFISLALTIGQDSIVKIHIPYSWTKFMVQCHRTEEEKEEELEAFRLAQGKVPFMTLAGFHQLHILLFVLVVIHVIYSVMIMALGMWKVSGWKHWEERASTAECSGEVRLAKDVTFIRRHAGNQWSKNVVLAYLAAFFQQFFMSVSETEYVTLRHGFIVKHKLPSNYDFHTYIMRSLEEDFKDVVGVSPYLWGFTIILILLSVDGWEVNTIAAILPLVMVLIVGTKLQYIITEMAIRYCEKNTVVEGITSVKPTDELFWFGKPHIILCFVHFILFQDAYQVSLHLWGKYSFSAYSCLSRHGYEVVIRLSLGVIAQALLGYVMLPTYSIVSQMGSEMRHKIINDDILMADVTNPQSNASASLIAES